jgi:copper chaperone CopZ
MKRSRFLLSCLLFAVLAAGCCFRPDIRTIHINVPRMRTPECAKIIQDALSTVDGVQAAQPDLQAGIITVTYDSTKLAIKNVEYVIAGAGFDANDAKAKPEARNNLPEGCR